MKITNKNFSTYTMSVTAIVLLLIVLAGCASPPQPVRPVALSPEPKPQVPPELMKPAPAPSAFRNRLKITFGLMPTMPTK